MENEAVRNIKERDKNMISSKEVSEKESESKRNGLSIYNPQNSKRTQLSLNSNKNNSNYNKKYIFHIFKMPKINEKIIQKNKQHFDQENNNILTEKNYYLNFNFSSEKENNLYVGDYLEEIYFNFLADQNQSAIKPRMGYMDNQSEINEKMRAILIDWIIEVHFHFNLRQETLFMTVSIIDSFLSVHFISKSKFQLLGITSLLIACKSQEIYYPHLNKFIMTTGGAYTKEDIIMMENEILKVLCFNIIYPTSNDFYNILSKLYNFDRKQYFLGQFFLENALIDYQMIKYSPNIIAASCIYIVMKLFKIEDYGKLFNSLIINVNNPKNTIKEVAKEIFLLVDNISKSRLNSVKNKYNLSKFENISQIM